MTVNPNTANTQLLPRRRRRTTGWKLHVTAAALLVLTCISDAQTKPTSTPTRTPTATSTPVPTQTPTPTATPTQMPPTIRQSASGWTSVVLLPPGAQGRRLDPASFLAEYAGVFGIAGGQLKLLRQENDSLGQTHLRYVQQKGGVPLIGAEVRLHLDAGGAVIMATGRGADVTDADTSAKLSAPQALVRERAIWVSRYGAPPKRELTPKLFLFSKNMLHQRPADEVPQLVWRVIAANGSGTVAHTYLIDAETGKLIMRLNATRSDVLRRVNDCGANDRQCHLDDSVVLAGHSTILGRSEGQPERALHPQFSERLGRNESNFAYDALGFAHNYFQNTFARTCGAPKSIQGRKGARTPNIFNSKDLPEMWRSKVDTEVAMCAREEKAGLIERTGRSRDPS